MSPAEQALESIWKLIYPGGVSKWGYPAQVARHTREEISDLRRTNKQQAAELKKLRKTKKASP